MDSSQKQAQARRCYLDFVLEFFGEVSSPESGASGLEIYKVAPQGLPQCMFTCGLSFSDEKAPLGGELLWNLSPDYDGKADESLIKELERLGQSLKGKGLPAVVALGEELSDFGYTHVLPWSVGCWKDPQRERRDVWVLIPLYADEAGWIEAHSPQEFALFYHTQVSEEGFFLLDVPRERVDPKKEMPELSCGFSL